MPPPSRTCITLCPALVVHWLLVEPLRGHEDLRLQCEVWSAPSSARPKAVYLDHFLLRPLLLSEVARCWCCAVVDVAMLGLAGEDDLRAGDVLEQLRDHVPADVLLTR